MTDGSSFRIVRGSTESLRYLLDTSVAVELRDYQDRIADRIVALASKPSISSVTRVELEGGVETNPSLKTARRRALDAMLRRLTIVDFDDAMAAAYGRIVEQAGFSRRKIIDRMIAATAIVRNMRLITLNAADVSDIDGLDFESWRD